MSFYDFLNKNLALVLTSAFIGIFIRSALSTIIYNNEDGTDEPIIGNRFKVRLYEPGELGNEFRRFITVWIRHYKPENKRLVVAFNILSVLLLLSALIIIAGLLIVA